MQQQIKFEKYVSCKWLESGVCFDNGVYGSNVKLCCYMSAPGGGNSMIFEDYHGEKIDWNEFFKIKNEYRNIQKSGDTVSGCRGCLILGQHALGNEENDHYCSRLTDDREILTRYVDQVSEGIRTGKFFYIAHPDILNFVGDDAFYTQEMTRLCRTAKENDIPLEINVLGIREKRNYPNAAFWRIAADVGCQVVLGADAHTPSHVFSKKGIDKARALALSAKITLTESLEDRFGD